MAKIALLFALLAVIQASWALKCKMCKDPACTTLEDQTCPVSPAGSDPACLVHIYKESKDAKDEIIDKKCVNVKDNKYDCVKTKSTDVEIKCTTCTTDLCNEKNAASKISMGSFAALSVLIALFAPKLL